MSYKDAGYDNFLTKGKASLSENTEDVVSLRTPQYSGTGIAGGISKSPDGNTEVDWESGSVNLSDRARYRIQTGNIGKTGNYGIRVTDNKGSIRLEFSDTEQLLSMFDTDHNEVIKIDEDGFHGYDTSGNELITVDGDGFHAFDTSSNELIIIDSDGFHGFLTDGTEQIQISGDGIEGYGFDGNTFKFYDEKGGTLKGQLGYLSAGPYFYFFSQDTAEVFVGGNQDTWLSSGNENTVYVSATGGAGSRVKIQSAGDVDMTIVGNLNVNEESAESVVVGTAGGILTFTKGILTNVS